MRGPEAGGSYLLPSSAPFLVARKAMFGIALDSRLRRRLPRRTSALAGLCSGLLAASVSLRAATTFYVDSDWSGTQSGTTSEPWKYLTETAWAAINSALATNSVTVYFSARNAASDTDQAYDTNGDGAPDPIYLSARADTGSSVLTLDGNSKYNTSDTAPSWASHSGESKNRVRYLTAQNPSHLKFNNITLHGFHVVTTDANKLIAIAGDNWIVENCVCEHTSTGSDGPGVYLIPTADSRHEGSADYTGRCTNIVIRNNMIHDTFGEALYIGGGGVMDGSPGSGYPSHSNIVIEGNTVYNAGVWGAEGDGMDVKGGIENLAIRGNEIYRINSTARVRAIVIQGQVSGASQTTMIERNRIHDCTGIGDAAIAVVDTWGTPQAVMIRNNVIYNVNGSGIMVYNSQDTVRIYNNTISACGSLGIISLGQVAVMNNLVFGNNGERAQVAFVGGAAQCDHNAYSGDWGYLPPGASSLSLSPADLANIVVNPTAGDFTLKVSSPLIGKAKVLGGFSNDVVNISRGAFWDIGAYQHTSSASRPRAPTGLKVIATQ